MKAVTLIRHAKAEPYEEYAVDFDRPLSGQGRKDARLMAKPLAAIRERPDWIIGSPALRAKETAQLLATALGLTESIYWEPNIYEASGDALLAILQVAPPAVEHVVLVGHNPGLADLVAMISAGGVPRLAIHLPTCGLVHLSLDIYQWSQLRRGCAQLKLLVAPQIVRRLVGK